MSKILKYPLDIGMNFLQIPGGVRRYDQITVQHQPGQPAIAQMWLEVDSLQPAKTVNVYVALTGEELPAGNNYFNLGTVQLHGGGFVVHALLLNGGN